VVLRRGTGLPPVLEAGKARSEVAGRMIKLTHKVLDVVEQTLGHPYDRALKLRAAVALLLISGIEYALSGKPTRYAMGQAE
jgi:hypothetical protein